ncbi:AfsR/SARP family transcriptional regulator [Actinophytocola sp.]|uniref:AfsR/SARP family transcriptional regulator n=1 Tax=Actinophytocola sp. TaxID=1872138 RepID=UPI002ED8FA45
MTGQLRFEVLGPVRAWRGDTEVELGSPQQRAVLAILLLRGGAPASTDQLISAIWGETAPRAAIGMVRSYVSRLRRVLGDGFIGSVGGGYALPAGSLDITDFQRGISAAREARHAGDHAAEAGALRSALALWKGMPLAGVNGEYAEYERTRLFQVRLAAVEDLAAADIELGRHVEAAADLAPVVIEQPLRERPRELLMLALYRSGRQAEALAVYQETRRLLDEQLGIAPGPELQEMQHRILVSDPALAGPPAPAPAVAATPAQLPPDLPDFTGRDDLLPGLRDALTPSDASVPVLGVVGLAGVGKTALAVHTGHAVAPNFPDGQLFVDLGATADPLAVLLRGLGAVVPDSPSEQVALWRTLTTGRRLLVVLDDARDADQVRPLLPGSGGAAVVITARQRLFGLAYVHWLKLDGLREDEALALFERLVGPARVAAEPAEARRFVAKASGLPQVVQAMGARVASRPGWSLATAGERIRPPSPGEVVRRPECTAIESPYESALDDLNPAQARAFRLLAVPDGPDISVAAAAAVLNVPVADAESLLESLADTHLIEPGATDRYRYLTPVRSFARGRALLDDGQPECQAALARLTAFYTASVRNAVLATRDRPGDASGLEFPTAESARTWLLLEHDHLWAAAAQTAGIPATQTTQLTTLLARETHSWPDLLPAEPAPLPG